jgi:GntR family galactonate operon transcriptional repressor
LKPSRQEESAPPTPRIGRTPGYGRGHAAASATVASGKIENFGLVDKVVDRIGGDIVAGQLKPAETLPNESGLCEQLGVSRSVLREAVRVLVSKGLLERKPRQGTRVCLPEAWSLLDPAVLTWLSAVEPQDRFVRELFGLRRAVEPAIAALAAECISEADLAALEASHRDMIAAGDDPERFFEPDFRFHQTVLRSVNNSLMQALGRVIMQALEINLRLSLPAPRGQQRSVPQHGAVLEAIRRRRPEAARRATIRLIDDAEEDVRRALAVSRKGSGQRRVRHYNSAGNNAMPMAWPAQARTGKE